MVRYVRCDIFKSGADVICHQVNCQGVMGSGVAKQVKDNFPVVYERYKYACMINSPNDLLGNSQFINTSTPYGTKFLGIFNLFAQDKFGYDGKCYTDYEALKKCLENVAKHLKARAEKTTIAIPYRMSCHRGGGDWKMVYKIIKETLKDYDVLICKYNGG